MFREIQRPYALSTAHSFMKSAVLVGLAIVLFGAGAVNAAEPSGAARLGDTAFCVNAAAT